MYSVIIPSLGRINYLNQLLQSIYNQTLLPEEIIILLDQNESCKNVAKFIYKKNNCNIIFCKNLNLSQKRNYGIEIAKTKFIIYSDDDDIWNKNKAELTIKSLKTSKVVCHEFTKFGGLIKSLDFFLEENLKLFLLVIFFWIKHFWRRVRDCRSKRNFLNIPI